MNMNPNENEPFLKSRCVQNCGMLPLLHRKLLLRLDCATIYGL
jgi:hypothetical protein